MCRNQVKYVFHEIAFNAEKVSRNQVRYIFHENGCTAEKGRKNVLLILSEAIKLLKELRLASISACI